MRPGSSRRGPSRSGWPASTGHRRADRELPGRGVPGLRQPAGHALIDRELYLPKEWADDPGRAEARGARRVGFQTKPELAQAMLERAVDGGVPAGWVTADEVYGGDRRLRVWLEETSLAYVLAVKAHRAAVGGRPAARPRSLPAELVAAPGPPAWLRLSAGVAKGPGLRLGQGRSDPLRLAGRGVLAAGRRRLTARELAFYACFGPADATLAELVRVAGIRWAVEEASRPPRPGRPGPLPGPPLPGIGISPCCWPTPSRRRSAPRPTIATAMGKGAVGDRRRW